jgi:hypothetical protein
LLVWGVATDGHVLDRLEVSLDGAQTWQPAELAPPAAPDAAARSQAQLEDGVIWHLNVPLTGGQSLVIYSRATDLAGNVERLGAPVRVNVLDGAARKIWLPLVNGQD